MSYIIEDTDLKKVGLELMFLTPQKYSNPDGITYVELSKLVGLPIDIVKKKLQILKEKSKLLNKIRFEHKHQKQAQTLAFTVKRSSAKILIT